MTARLLHVAAAPFEAARRVSILPKRHRSRRLHGHSFLARVRAELPAGWAPFPGGETDALRDHLTHCIAALDYHDLNEHLPVPTDENLARWVRARLRVPGIEAVGIRSTRDQGADLDGSDHAHLWRRFRFEAAHQLPNVPPGHKCGRMHGHGFQVILHADQDLRDADMGIDFDQLGAVWAPLHRILHSACLNDLPGLANPRDLQVSSFYHIRRERPRYLGGHEEFADFLRWKLDPERPYQYHLDTSIELQTDYLIDLHGALVVDFIGHYERLEDDFAVVCERIGIVPPPLAHKRKAADRKRDYRGYYSDETAELVARHFKRDIELLGYTFDPKP